MKISNCNIENNTFTGIEWHTATDTTGVQRNETLLLCIDGKEFCTGFLTQKGKWCLSDDEGNVYKTISNVTHWAKINQPI